MWCQVTNRDISYDVCWEPQFRSEVRARTNVSNRAVYAIWAAWFRWYGTCGTAARARESEILATMRECNVSTQETRTLLRDLVEQKLLYCL